MRRLMFYAIVCMALAPPISALRAVSQTCVYWFDDGFSSPMSTEMVDGQLIMSVDASTLSDGLHTLNIRAYSGNVGSALHSWLFMKATQRDTVTHSVISLSYWLDDDQAHLVTLPIQGNELSFNTDVTNLTDGLHQLRYYVTNDQGMKGDLHTWLFMKAAQRDTVTHRVTSLSYWLDDDQAHLVTLPIQGDELSFMADATNLTDGLHQLRYYVTNDQGMKGDLHTWLFMKAAQRDTVTHRVTSLSYWLDDDQAHLVTLPIQGDELSFTADATNLTDGLHQLRYYVTNDQGMKGDLHTWLFMKVAQRDTVTHRVTSLSYWLDVDQAHLVTLPIQGDELSFTADATNLTDGLHQISFFITNDQGVRGELHAWLFLKEALRDTTSINQLVSLTYWIDADIANANAITIDAPNDSISFIADASSLASGLHTLTYFVVDKLNNRSALQTWTFFKDNYITDTMRISWCKYWWNDHYDKAIKEVIDCDSATYVYNKQIEVPLYAKVDGFSDSCVARLSMVFGNEYGQCSPVLCADVAFPDEIAPETILEADCTETTGSVTLSWRVVNDKLKYYNVYYSENGQYFVLWLPNTTQTTAVFEGQAGSVYRFAVIATDKVGNRGTLDENNCVTVRFISTETP